MKNPLRLIFPNKCYCCGKIIEENKALCPVCEKNIERIPQKNICDKCGVEKIYCNCKRNAYSFTSVCAPFYNVGIAKKAFYKYKLNHMEFYFKYFAQQMVMCFDTYYSNLEFDYIAYVPNSKSHLRERGFDQVKNLAKYISEQIGIPICDAIVHSNTGSQRDLNRQNRKKFITGRFNVNGKVSGRVLLIDDICTTGATLNECTRVLFAAGAGEVYCLTALLGVLNFKGNDNLYKAIGVE